MMIQILEQWDGCPGRALTLPMPRRAVNRTIRELRRMGYTDDRLLLVDLATGRAISWVFPR